MKVIIETDPPIVLTKIRKLTEENIIKHIKRKQKQAKNNPVKKKPK